VPHVRPAQRVSSLSTEREPSSLPTGCGCRRCQRGAIRCGPAALEQLLQPCGDLKTSRLCDAQIKVGFLTFLTIWFNNKALLEGKLLKPAATTLLIVVMCVAFACRAPKPAIWSTYNSPEGRYSVLFPDKPELSKDNAPARTGEILVQNIALCTDPEAGNWVIYSVSYFDFPPTMDFSFDGSRDGYLQAGHATLQSEKPFQFGAYQGREIRATAKDSDKDLILLAKFILVERRVYLIQFIFPKSYESPRSAEKSAKFFDSFALTNSI
jgi:hypothetical protein